MTGTISVEHAVPDGWHARAEQLLADFPQVDDVLEVRSMEHGSGDLGILLYRPAGPSWVAMVVEEVGNADILMQIKESMVSSLDFYDEHKAKHPGWSGEDCAYCTSQREG